MTPPIIQGNSFGNRGNTDLFVPDSEGYIDANWTGFKSITEANKALFIKVFLQGAALNPFAGEENLMRDNLRLLGLLPFESPYEDAETLFDSTFVETTEGEDAIVDWIFVELRDALNSSIVIEGKSALLQRDGDVVGIDAVSPLQFASTPDDYFIAIKHRNHLGVVLERVKRLSSVATPLDFSRANAPITLGTNAQTDIGMPANTIGLWSGDANADGTVRFSGTDAEPTAVRDTVLNASGNPFGSLLFTLNGYLNQDINMDGQVRFSGGNSEPLFVRDNVLGNPGNPFGSLLFGISTQIPQN